ncbi:MAG: DUF438 domain-containing protein [Spirochaetales bacterium]|nr:DUF438 domain-containing protein [Spirochaetales bacterium]
MSEYIHNDSDREKKLKEIIMSLHEGKSLESVKKEFAALIKKVSPEEISAMENALINEGFPPEQIQKLCDVHVSVFNASLKKYKTRNICPVILLIHTFTQWFHTKAIKALICN